MEIGYLTDRNLGIPNYGFAHFFLSSAHYSAGCFQCPNKLIYSHKFFLLVRALTEVYSAKESMVG